MTGLRVNTPDPSVMVKSVPPTDAITVQVWVCEPPGMAVNVVGPQNEYGQAIAVRVKIDTEHSTINTTATLKQEA